ncbi:hypothetical protein VP01_14973g1, partial [Puccinia sorghi]
PLLNLQCAEWIYLILQDSIQSTEFLLPHGTNPSSVFVQQELKDWIEWFLSLPEVEASIEEGSAQTSNPEIITDYVHSRAYKKIAAIPRRQASKHAPLNLVFS